MDSNQPLISVIVPIYNAEPYLDQCLKSIEGQSYRNIEILCLNDGSTDNSQGIIARHAAADARIIPIDKPNQGYGATCNRGLDEARGDYLSIIEPDDWIEPDMYTDMLAFAATLAEDADIIKTPYWRILMPDTPRQAKINCSYKGRIRPPRQPFGIGSAAHLLTHHPSIWSALYRRSFLERHAIRFREFPGAGWADNPFLVETLCQARRIAYLDSPYYCYREETPEKTAAFAQRSPLMPFERWEDMADVLERLRVYDEAIWRAHNSRGFTYLSFVIGGGAAFEGEVYQAVRRMFSRMDPGLVFSDPGISPADRRMFAEVRGVPLPPLKRLPYYRALVAQGLYSLHNAGLGYTLATIRRYLAKSTASRAR